MLSGHNTGLKLKNTLSVPFKVYLFYDRKLAEATHGYVKVRSLSFMCKTTKKGMAT